jgi:hypothetical protein
MKICLINAAFLALTILGGQTARAGIVFDSITGSTAVGETSIAGLGPLGDSFMIGNSFSALSDVKVGIYNPSAISVLGSSVTVSLYASNGMAPTAFLDTLGSVTTSSITAGLITVVDFSNFTPINLNSNTTYFILLSTSNASTLEAVETNNLLGTGVAQGYDYYNGTAQTNVLVGGTFEMQITTVPSAVPEPSSLVLCGIAGLGRLAYRVRRRRRTSSAN